MKLRLGIIGGGQLGLYLCEAAQGLGMQVTVISESADDAALQRADRPIVGALDSRVAIDELLTASDVITFDKEAIPDATLAYLAQAEAGGPVSIHPRANTLLMLKDKAVQKSWLQRHNLPTLPFRILSGRASCPASPDRIFGGPLVQKSRCGGYDGRGVQILRSAKSNLEVWDTPSILEPYLPDCREISVITARARTGEMQTYPPVSMEFDAQLNSVKLVSMPAAIDPVLAAEATALAERTVTLLDGVGVFAVEMFITPTDELLINEISPRVHNSGHLTLDACNVSQFEQHVRAVTGLPLVPLKPEPAAAVMLNILYTESIRENCPARPDAQRGVGSRTSIYWYGKEPGTPGRKMGHINALAPSVSAAVELAHSAMTRLHSHNDGQAA